MCIAKVLDKIQNIHHEHTKMNNSTSTVDIYLIHCSTFEMKIIFNAFSAIIFQDHFSTFGQTSLTSGYGLASIYIIFLLLLDL